MFDVLPPLILFANAFESTIYTIIDCFGYTFSNFGRQAIERGKKIRWAISSKCAFKDQMCRIAKWIWVFKRNGCVWVCVSYHLDCLHQWERLLGVLEIWRGSWSAPIDASMCQRNHASCASVHVRVHPFRDRSTGWHRLSLHNYHCHFGSQCN